MIDKKCSKSIHSIPFQIPIKLDDLVRFYPFQKFNQIQLECSEYLIHTNKNALICAPTASGKTILLDFCIFQKFLNDFESNKSLIIYVAPLKAICREKMLIWIERLQKIYTNLPIQELTGDSDFDVKKDSEEVLISNGLLIATPEKLNQILRKWRENIEIVQNISLFMIDEIHFLNDSSRGIIIESMISRILMLNDFEELQNHHIKNVRIIGLSATIQNKEDFRQYLRADKIFNFGEEYRPIQLIKKVLGYLEKKNYYLFDISLNYRLNEVIRRYSNKKSTLIFVSTQKSSIKTCKDLISIGEMRELIENPHHQELLNKLATQVENPDLKYALVNGIAFHHASLNLQDRILIEESFKNGTVKILVSTTTLALGINLPAYLVVIKGTQGYKRHFGYQEYQYHELCQMMGRAGRPQFETQGMVVIMTERSKVNQIEFMINNESQGQEIKSNFLKMFKDNVNNEISMKTLNNRQQVISYFQSSLAYIQANDHIKEKDLIDDTLQTLENSEWIQSFGENKEVIKSTDIGYYAAKFCFSIENYEEFKNYTLTDEESLLKLLSRSKEFEQFYSLVKERKALQEQNQLNQFALKKRVSINTADLKIFVILQTLMS